MKILIFMSGFFPGKKYGGPPVSIDNFCSLMSDEDIYIVCKDHDLGETKRYNSIHSGWNDRDNCKVLYVSYSEYSFSYLNNISREIDPDLIYLQSLFSKATYIGLNVAKKNNIKVLLAPRGELNKGAFKKKYKKIPYIYFLQFNGLLKNVYYQSTSDEETIAVRNYLKVGLNKINYLTNIPSIPKCNYKRVSKKQGKAKIVFLSRIHPKKNLLKAIKYLKNVQGELEFDIYGPIEDKKYWELCKQEIQSNYNVSIKYCGTVEHDKVQYILSKYNAFLFPTQSENYGHVIAEALSVGTPAIISDQTPWSDIINYKAGWSIPINDALEYEKAIQTVIDWDSDTFRQIISSTKKYFEQKTNLDKTRKNYKGVLDEITD